MFGLSDSGRNIAIVAIASLAVHFAVTLLVNNQCDFYYWTTIMQNVETGNGLYELNGNFYTPIWGYLLSFADLIFKETGLFPEFVRYFEEITLTGVVDTRGPIQATPMVNFFLKLPLAICDVIVGYLIYGLVERFTEDKKKALIAMCLWCFCPIVIFMTAVQGQFDTISVLLVLICIYLILNERTTMAGAMLSVGVFLKMFPIFCAFVFVGFVYIRHKDDGTAFKKILLALAGFISATVLIYLPCVLFGEVSTTFGFLTSRASNNILSTVTMLLGCVIVFIMMVYLGMKMARHDNPRTEERDLILYSGACILASTLICNGFQYAPSMLVFLILFIYLSPKKASYMTLYWVIGLAALIEAVLWMGGTGLFMDAVYYGFFNVSDLAAMANAPSFLGEFSVCDLFGIVRNIAIYITVIFILIDTTDLKKFKICQKIDRICKRGVTDEA